jgi:hypothetical protein
MLLLFVIVAVYLAFGAVFAGLHILRRTARSSCRFRSYASDVGALFMFWPLLWREFARSSAQERTSERSRIDLRPRKPLL